GYLIGLLLREGFSRIIKLEAVPLLNKWGGLILGFVRTFFLVALITFCLFISTISHFRTQIGNSYMASRMLKVAPDTYGKIWYGIMSKFMPNEKFNPTISEIEKEF
ncbi:MAG: CvpA family protein, partial [Deltaproteobacteria bacterium]